MGSLGSANLEIGANTEKLAAALEASEAAVFTSLGSISDMMSGLGDEFAGGFENMFSGFDGVDLSIGKTVRNFKKITGSIKALAALAAIRIPFIGGIITKLLGPITAVITAVGTLGVFIHKNFEVAIKVTTQFINKIIDLRNKFTPVRVIVDLMILQFRNLMTVGKGIVKQFKIVFSAIGDGVSALLKGDFGKIKEVFTKAFKDSYDNIKKTTEDVVDNVSDAWKQFGEDLEPVTEDQVKKILGPLGDIGGFLTGLFSKVDFKKLFKKKVLALELDILISGADKSEANLKANLTILETLLGKSVKNIETQAKRAGKAWKRDFDDKIKQSAVITTELIRRKFSNAFTEIRRDIANTLGEGAADIITNIFQGVDTERLKELNAELRQTREILSDQTSTNEQKDAARARIALIEAEIKAEKQRGNVILQTAKLAIDTAKSVIKSMLAKAIAGMIAGEANKGIVGLITAGIGIAAISALFSSKVPKLARGGVSDGPANVIIGDNPSGKELVHPWERNEEFSMDIARHINKYSKGGGGEIYQEVRFSVDEIIIMLHNGLPGFIRKHGFNPLVV